MGSAFRRVTLTDPNRFGLLGQGSILTLTSMANRTSPVQRGKYVMEVLLGVAPPPPPAMCRRSRKSIENEKPLPVRERLDEHRTNPACAACHKMMDPIGLSLENFDAVGLWRTNDSGAPVDPTGEMYDGTKLDGPMSLRARHSEPVRRVHRQLHREPAGLWPGPVSTISDMPAVRAIERDAAKNNNRFSSFVLGVVKSAPFQMRKADDVGTDDGRSRAANEEQYMFITKKHLSRRTVLRGMGATLALPFLDAMVPAQTPLRENGGRLAHPPGLHRDGAWRGRQHAGRHRQALLDRRRRKAATSNSAMS